MYKKLILFFLSVSFQKKEAEKEGEAAPAENGVNAETEVKSEETQEKKEETPAAAAVPEKVEEPKPVEPATKTEEPVVVAKVNHIQPALSNGIFCIFCIV